MDYESHIRVLPSPARLSRNSRRSPAPARDKCRKEACGFETAHSGSARRVNYVAGNMQREFGCRVHREITAVAPAYTKCPQDFFNKTKKHLDERHELTYLSPPRRIFGASLDGREGQVEPVLLCRALAGSGVDTRRRYTCRKMSSRSSPFQDPRPFGRPWAAR
jgi:hypothetical protein